MRPAVTPRRDSWHELLIERLKDHPKAVSVTGSSIMVLSLLYFLLFSGGNSDALNNGPEEVHPLKDAYPIMLDGQTLRASNTNWKLYHDAISDVEVHEISDKASDGSYTATISFNLQRRDGDVKAKVEITYNIKTVRAQKGFSIPTYSVSKVKSLSIEKIGNE